ncbi:MAG TPA: hypothetical protein VFL77_07595 [Solirubrobacterales bacterium]|nr:hypothetical protein [Solirubrobacterales bacterium]
MAAKSKPFSIRISTETEELIAAEARRTRRSKGAVIEGLAEEALRTRTFPGIAFRGEDWDRRPWVIGTAFDVWQVIDAYRDAGSVEAMVAAGNLSERQVRLALAYYERFPEEVDEAIALNRRPLAQLRAEYPFIDVHSPAAK